MLSDYASWFMDLEAERRRNVAIAKAMLAKLQAMAREQAAEWAAEQATRESNLIRLPDPAMFTATEILKLNELRQRVRTAAITGDTQSFESVGWEAYLRGRGLL